MNNVSAIEYYYYSEPCHPPLPNKLLNSYMMMMMMTVSLYFIYTLAKDSRVPLVWKESTANYTSLDYVKEITVPNPKRMTRAMERLC